VGKAVSFVSLGFHSYARIFTIFMIGHSITIPVIISCNQDILHLSVKSSIETIATSDKGNILPPRLHSTHTVQTLD
jgi:hypothetical protein